MKSSNIPILPWLWVRLPTPDEVHESLGHAAQNYGNWLQANVHWRDVGKKPEKLNRIRVLDCSVKSMGGHWCSSLFAEHGADVIMVEPPGGDPARRHTPFYHQQWMFKIEGKFLHECRNNMTLNLESVEGRELFKKLAVVADVVIENYPPGQFDAWGIGYRQLSEINPRLVYGWIWELEDELSSEHLPSWVSDYVRGTFLAMGIMTGLNYRERISHRGQFVDATAASGIMRMLEIEYQILPPHLGEETTHRSIWRTFSGPPGHDNVEVYRRLLGLQKDDVDHLKSKGII